MPFKVIVTKDFNHMSEVAAQILIHDIKAKLSIDEYIGLPGGLPGKNPQQRATHPESYSFFMVQELFGLLQ